LWGVNKVNYDKNSDGFVIISRFSNIAVVRNILLFGIRKINKNNFKFFEIISLDYLDSVGSQQDMG